MLSQRNLNLQRVARRTLKLPNSSYEPTRFQLKYHDDPAAFARDCFFWTKDKPAPYQESILAALPEHHKVSERGPHGIGKSATASWAILWFALTRDGLTDWKIPITASAWRQVVRYLFPELHKWIRRLNWTKVGREPFRQPDELQMFSFRLATGEAFGVVGDQPSSIEGAHASEMLYVLDEAKAIPEPFWQAVEGAFAAGICYAFAGSTPGETSGVFFDIHNHSRGYEDWYPLHVTSDDAIRAGRMTAEWREQRKRQWGEKSPVYLNRVEGEFAQGGTDQLIPLRWVELANERYLDLKESDALKDAKPEQVGGDIARYGDDATVIAPRWKHVVQSITYKTQQDTMRTAGDFILAVGANNLTTPLVLDVDGLGAGVVDRLSEQKYTVYGVNNGKAATDRAGRPLTDKSGELTFVNMRSYLWWLLRERLDPDGDDPIALPPDTEAVNAEDKRSLTSDLTGVKWHVTSSGRIEVESKDDMKKRLGRSPDAADAVALSLVPIDVVYKRRGIMF